MTTVADHTNMQNNIKKKHYKLSFDFETITSEYKHMPYLCWVYNDDIQQ